MERKCNVALRAHAQKTNVTSLCVKQQQSKRLSAILPDFFYCQKKEIARTARSNLASSPLLSACSTTNVMRQCKSKGKGKRQSTQDARKMQAAYFHLPSLSNPPPPTYGYWVLGQVTHISHTHPLTHTLTFHIHTHSHAPPPPGPPPQLAFNRWKLAKVPKTSLGSSTAPGTTKALHSAGAPKKNTHIGRFWGRGPPQHARVVPRMYG